MVVVVLVIIGGGLAGLAALHHGSSSQAAPPPSPETVQNITSDSYFYGQSPPVYPSRMSSPLTNLCFFTPRQS